MLKSGSNVILLDEPTNDLDTETLTALEDALEEYAGCAVVISHDRMFLDRLATHILAFEGDSHVEWFEGNFEDYEQDKIRRLGPDLGQSQAPELQAPDPLTGRGAASARPVPGRGGRPGASPRLSGARSREARGREARSPEARIIRGVER